MNGIVYKRLLANVVIFFGSLSFRVSKLSMSQQE